MSAASARVERLKLSIAYDGGPFRGWQSQKGGNTIQDYLQNAFAAVCEEKVVVNGAGRTDAGVHALRQCAHADVRKNLEPSQWPHALNFHLPREIRVLQARMVNKKFHARYSAREKIYSYRIWNTAVHSPFELGKSWHLVGRIDLPVLERCAKLLTGRHDFAAFAANRGKPDENTVRTISSIDVRKRGPLLTLSFRGDGFLYKMVRLLTGTLIQCAQGRADVDLVRRLLTGDGKSSFAAPAEGLYLVRVIY